MLSIPWEQDKLWAVPVSGDIEAADTEHWPLLSIAQMGKDLEMLRCLTERWNKYRFVSCRHVRLFVPVHLRTARTCRRRESKKKLFALRSSYTQRKMPQTTAAL